MLALLSPAKDLKVEPNPTLDFQPTIPEFTTKASALITDLRKLKPDELSSLTNISAKLANLNYQRYKVWKKEHTQENSEIAITTFKGEVYRGLKADELNIAQLNYAQQMLRILSGLYGVLKPLDLVQEYRLEMGTKHPFRGKKNLYEYWKLQIVRSINQAIETSLGEKVLVNLASNEYYSAIDTTKLKYPIVTPIFMEEKNGSYKTIIVYAKKARGLMTRFMIDNKIEQADNLKAFDYEGYYYNTELSVDSKLVFTR